MKAKEDDRGGIKLVGYGHALYAYRYPDGHIIYFKGWRGRSHSTDCHLSKMGLKSCCDKGVDKREKAGSFDPDDYRQRKREQPVLGT